ncbi:MAG: hypothetical protein WD851_18760 [Pirellulales bacterium]
MNRLIVTFALFSLAGSAAVAQPQIPRPGTPEYREWELRRQQQVKPEDWTVSGKIYSFNVRAGEINVISDEGRRWRVKLGTDAPVNVKGEGGAEFLQPRTAVRFYAPITKRKLVTEPVAMLTTFSPRQEFEPTLEPTTEEEARAAMAEEEASEEGGDLAATDAEFDPATGDERPTLQDRINREPTGPVRRRPSRDRDAKADEAEEAEWFHVQGILVSVKKGKFVVDAGEGGKIRGELAEDAKVEADLLGVQFANPGDVIKAKGQTYPTEANTALASSVDVTLSAQPETTEEKPRRASRPRSRRGENSEQPPNGASTEKP